MQLSSDLSPARPISLRGLAYLSSLLPAVLVVYGNMTGGPWVLANTVLTLGMLPLLERVWPQNHTNTENEDASLPNAILFLHLAAQLLAVSSLIYGSAMGIITGGWVWVAALSTGLNSGSAAITVGHELCHRRERYWQLGAKWLMFSAGNPYFITAHLGTHHRLVATADDSTTARRNEHLYAFIYRSVVGQLRDTFRYEAQRLQKAGQLPYSPMNYGVGSILLFGVLAVVLGFTFSPLTGLVFVLQALVANFLLEYTNYIQHYGLLRKKEDGVLERVNPHHAWESNHTTRFMLIDLTRHPDHHTFGAKPYHKLNAHSESPNLPTGYAGMIYLALLPPLFISIMNKRLDKLGA